MGEQVAKEELGFAVAGQLSHHIGKCVQVFQHGAVELICKNNVLQAAVTLELG